VPFPYIRVLAEHDGLESFGGLVSALATRPSRGRSDSDLFASRHIQRARNNCPRWRVTNRCRHRARANSGALPYVAFVYDIASFSRRRTLSYAGEGWGLTRDQNGFILSDGTDQLRFLHPDAFREVRRLTVTDGGVPVRDLNELEYIRGEVYANVWHTDRIARISPQTGRVVAWIDVRGLMATGYRLDPEAVLNGIAYDATSNRLFVTGKLWPRLFEIEVVPRK
jgi:hypothetical protein